MLPVGCDVTDTDSAELTELQVGVWQKFHGTCLQYQQYVSEPVGLTESASGSVNVIKKVGTLYVLAQVACIRKQTTLLFISIVSRFCSFVFKWGVKAAASYFKNCTRRFCFIVGEGS